MICVQPCMKRFRANDGVFGKVSRPSCVSFRRVFSPSANNSNATNESPSWPLYRDSAKETRLTSVILQRWQYFMPSCSTVNSNSKPTSGLNSSRSKYQRRISSVSVSAFQTRATDALKLRSITTVSAKLFSVVIFSRFLITYCIDRGDEPSPSLTPGSRHGLLARDRGNCMCQLTCRARAHKSNTCGRRRRFHLYKTRSDPAFRRSGARPFDSCKTLSPSPSHRLSQIRDNV